MLEEILGAVLLSSFPSRNRYFHQLDALLMYASCYPLILRSSNNYLRWSDKYLETVSIIGIILNFEQVLDCELFLLQVIYSEKLNSIISCIENVVVGPHDSLYRK